jgi:hypothetical protein
MYDCETCPAAGDFCVAPMLFEQRYTRGDAHRAYCAAFFSQGGQVFA